jgi:hypothetical protein
MQMLLAALLLFSGAQKGTPGHNGKGSANNGYLAPLPCDASTSCDLHFVADAWSGSGNWTSSDSNAWVAVKTGSPTKQASGFPGRSEITSFSTLNFFSAATSNSHSLVSGTSFTYEALIKFPAGDVTGSVAIVASSARFSSGSATASVYSAGGFRSGDTHARDGTGDYSSSQFGNFATLGRYYLFSWVYDVSAQKTFFYVNGTAQGSAFTWSRGAPAGPLSTTFDIGECAAFPGLPFNNGGATLEILRHRSALSSATVLARAALFNTLRGY